MSINIYKNDVISAFGMTTLSNCRQLKDIKINGKYVNKIYWCNPDLFPASSYMDNCGLIYRRHKDIVYTVVSGHVYDILKYDKNSTTFNKAAKLNDAEITFNRIYTRNPKTYTGLSFSLGKDDPDAVNVDDGYYTLNDMVVSNSTFKVSVQRRNYASYIDTALYVNGTLDNPYSYDIFLNPVDESIGRVILTWGAYPSNLDLFVISPNGTQLSVNSGNNIYGFVTSTDSNQYGPEIVTLNTYCDIETPLKLGGRFDLYVKWVSDDSATSMNANVKLFADQIGTRNLTTDTNTTDTFKRNGEYWHAGALCVSSGIKPIELTSDDIITYESQINLSQLESYGSVVDFYNKGNEVYYTGVITDTLDNNQFTLNYNSIISLLKNYPFQMQIFDSASAQITNYKSNLSSNFSNNVYTAQYNLSKLPSGNIHVKLYLNQALKSENTAYYTTTLQTTSGNAILSLNDVFRYKNIPIILEDSNKNLLNEFQYVYKPYQARTNWSAAVEPYYIIRKHLYRNEYFLIKNKINNGYIKFNLGLYKTVNIKNVNSANSYSSPETFNTIQTYVFRNNNQLNGFNIIKQNPSTIVIKGDLNINKQRFFDPYWIQNFKQNGIWFNSDSNTWQDQDWYGDSTTCYNYKLREFYNGNSWNYSNFNNYRLYNYPSYINYITNKDEYRLQFLDVSNILSSLMIDQSYFTYEYISVPINKCIATANNLYVYYSDLSGGTKEVLDPYLLVGISSVPQGNFDFTYAWDNNGVNVSFNNKAPTGQNCTFIFKRITNYINRQVLSGYQHHPHVYIKDGTSSINQIASWDSEKVTIDYFQQMSGYSQLALSFVDFDRMYTINTEKIDQYTCNLTVNFNLNKISTIKQPLGFKFLLWQQQEDGSWYIRYSNESMATDGYSQTIYELQWNKNYKFSLYLIYKRQEGNLSGIYRDNYTNYKDRTYYWQYNDDHNKYNDYIDNTYVEDVFPLDLQHQLTLSGNSNSVSGKYDIALGQFYGTVYTSNDIEFNNDLNGIAILSGLTNNMIYNCSWNGTKVYSIDYIYPGTYKLILTYGGLQVYEEDIVFNASNISVTTSKSFKTNISFRTLKYNVYNSQTSTYIADGAPTDSNVTRDYNDNSNRLYVRIYGRQNITDPNEESYLTNTLHSNNSETTDDRFVTSQLINNALLKFTLKYADSNNYPLKIDKLQQNNKEIPFTYTNQTCSAVLFNSNDLSLSGETIKVYASNYYWNSTNVYFNFYNRYGKYVEKIQHLSATFTNTNTNQQILVSNDYDQGELSYYGLSDLNNFLNNYIFNYYMESQYYQSYSKSFYIYKNNGYAKTGTYKFSPYIHFSNTNNKDIQLESYTYDIYDDYYYLYYIPKDYSLDTFNIKPVLALSTQQDGTIKYGLKTNTALGTTVFYGNASSVVDYQLIKGLYATNLTNSPKWDEYDWHDYDFNRTGYTNVILLSALNYWFLSFDMYQNKNVSSILSPIGLYEVDNSQVTDSEILSTAHSVGKITSGGDYSGLAISGISLQASKNYILVYGTSDDISVRGYLKDGNGNWWYDTRCFDINVYKLENKQQILSTYVSGNISSYISGSLSSYTHTTVQTTPELNTNTPLFTCLSTSISGVYVSSYLSSYISSYLDGENQVNTQINTYISSYISGTPSGFIPVTITGDIEIDIENPLTSCLSTSLTGIYLSSYLSSYVTSTLIKSFENYSNSQIDMGLIKPGTYGTQIFLHGASSKIDYIHPDYQIQQWTNTFESDNLFRTSLKHGYLRLNGGYNMGDRNYDQLRNNFNYQIINTSQSTDYMRNIFSYYNTWTDYWTIERIVQGTYDIKYTRILADKSVQKSILNITSGGTFSIPVSTLYNWVKTEYKQVTPSCMMIGTLTEQNGSFVPFDAENTGTVVSGKFRSSRYKNIPSAITLHVGQLYGIQKDIVIGNNNVYKDFYTSWDYAENINYIRYNSLPTYNNLHIKLYDDNNLFTNEADSNSINYTGKIKTGTVIYTKIYHDSDQLLGSSRLTVTYNNHSQDGTNCFTGASVKISFYDTITNQLLGMTYPYMYDPDRYDEYRRMQVYHNKCYGSGTISYDALTASNMYYYVNGVRSPEKQLSNLLVNDDYIIKYRTGYDGEFSGYFEVSALPTSGISLIKYLSYGTVKMRKNFYNRSNSNNSIGSSQATLILERCQNDGYDLTYTFNGNNEDTYIRSGKYIITLVSKVSNQQQITYLYETENMLSGDFTMSNYVGTTQVPVTFELLNSEGNSYTYSSSKQLYIVVYHNGLIYAKKSYTSGLNSLKLTLYNVPYTVGFMDQTGALINVTSVKNNQNNAMTVTDNKFSFDISTESQKYTVKLN